MPSQVTVTGKVGPGIAVTSQVYTNVTGLDFQIARGILVISYNTSGNMPETVDVDILAQTTVTFTWASGVATVVVS